MKNLKDKAALASQETWFLFHQVWLSIKGFEQRNNNLIIY